MAPVIKTVVQNLRVRRSMRFRVANSHRLLLLLLLCASAFATMLQPDPCFAFSSRGPRHEEAGMARITAPTVGKP